MLNIDINEAKESYKHGFSVTYDGDNRVVKFGQNCNRCSTYFESCKREIYCLQCLSNFIGELQTVSKYLYNI